MKGQYIQFFTKSKTTNVHMLVEIEGEIGKQKLDGRLSLPSCCNLAAKFCRERGFNGFRICKNVSQGEISLGNYLTDLWKVFPNSIEC